MVRLTNQFNTTVVERIKADPSLKLKFKKKTVQLMKSGVALASEAQDAKNLIKNYDRYKSMRKMLLSNDDVSFPMPDEMIMQAPPSPAAVSVEVTLVEVPPATATLAALGIELNTVEAQRTCGICFQKCQDLVDGIWIEINDHIKNKRSHGGFALYPICNKGGTQIVPSVKQTKKSKESKRNKVRSIKRKMKALKKKTTKKKKKSAWK